MQLTYEHKSKMCMLSKFKKKKIIMMYNTKKLQMLSQAIMYVFHVSTNRAKPRN